MADPPIITRLWRVDLGFVRPTKDKRRTWLDRLTPGVLAATAEEAISAARTLVPEDAADVTVWSVNHIGPIHVDTQACTGGES